MHVNSSAMVINGRRCLTCHRLLGIHRGTGRALRHFCHSNVDTSTRFPEDDEYRYGLSRRWGVKDGPAVLWILANPSTADGEVDDPTIADVCTLTRDLTGYRSLVVMNLYAMRATEPEALTGRSDLVGEANRHIEAATKQADIDRCIVGWGQCLFGVKHHDVPLAKRIREIETLVARLNPLECLGYTKGQLPRHPLDAARKKVNELLPWPPT